MGFAYLFASAAIIETRSKDNFESFKYICKNDEGFLPLFIENVYLNKNGWITTKIESFKTLFAIVKDIGMKTARLLTKRSKIYVV